jgi:hypothetical protein
MEITEKEACIAKNMAWLVGRCLSFIDITVESTPSPGDKYPKKDVLKKLFEEQIYDTRNDMFARSTEEILSDIDDLFDDLFAKLTSLATAAISDKTQRNEFLNLVTRRMNDTKNKIKAEI